MEDRHRRRLPLVRLELSRARLLRKILRKLPDFPSAQELPEKEVIQLVFLARRLFASQTSLLELDIPRPRTRNWNANAVVPPSNDSEDPVLHILGDVHGQFQDLLRIFEAVGFQLGSQVESVEREVGQLERECADLSAVPGSLPAAALGRPLLQLLKANPVAPAPPVAPPNASRRGINIVVGQSKSMSSSHRHQHGVSSPPPSKVFAAGASNVKSVLLDSPPMHGLVPGSPGVHYRERSGGATKVFDTPMSPLRLPFSSGGLLGGAFGGGGEGSKPLSARRPSRENTAHDAGVARNKSPQNYNDGVEGSVLHAAAARRSPRSNAASPPPHQNQFRLGSENLASLAPVATDSCKKSRYELELAQSPDRSSDREKRRLQRHVSSPSVDSILWKRTGHADAEEIRQRESFAQAVDGSRWWQNGRSPEPSSGMSREQGDELARRRRASSLPSLAGSCVSARSAGRVFLPSSGLRQESGAGGASFGERFARSREAIQRKRSMQQAGIRSCDHMVVVDEDGMDGESGIFPAAKRPRVAGAAVGQHGHFGEQGGGMWGKNAHAVLQDAARRTPPRNKNRSHRFLFLGDYVDRGMRSIDVVCLLYALALLPPQHAHTSAGGAHDHVIQQKIPTRAAFDDHSDELLPAPLVSLLRGNHECPCINRVYGFYDECKRRYSVRLWKCFVDSFNMLPVAAVVNDKIICMHGGLSPELQHLDDIRAISRPTAVPSEGLLCDLLWSDPDDEVLGWAANDRGISHVFGADVVDEILMRLNGEWVEEAGEWALQGGEEEDEQKGTTPPTAKVLEIEDVEMVPVEDDAGMQEGEAKQDGEKTHPVAGQRGDGSPHNSPPAARPAGSAATETSAVPPCFPMKNPNSASPSPKAVAPNQSPTPARAAAPKAARPRSNAVLPNIELIVRAHQVVQDGYEFFANRKLVTLFSAPNYCGEFDNAAAVLSVSNTLRCRLHVVKAKNVE